MNVFKNNIEKDLKVLGKIKEVKVSTSFKNNVLNNIDDSTVETENYYQWFTPKLQVAAMLIVLFVNAIAVYHLFENNENDSLEDFGEYYNITSKSTF